jgi:hypothetical protein
MPSFALGMDRKPRTQKIGHSQRNFREAVAAAIPEHAKNKPIEVWFQML